MSDGQFRFTNFQPQIMARIQAAQAILSEYDQKLTVRQLYYQFVARDLLENTPRNYQNLTSWVTDARYAGLIDWDAIEDRGREPSNPPEWDSLDELVEAAIDAFRLPRWKDQDYYVELWVEKQALAGVLFPIARRHHVTLMVNKGYSSASAMYASAMRMHAACGSEPIVICDNCGSYPYEREGRRCTSCEVVSKPVTETAPRDIDRSVVVLYLGDHDPSGEDMVRDIRDRLTEFGVPNLDVQKVALTMEQIRKHKPPPNPAKLSDSRAAAYINKYGEHSWELDALPPRVLNKLVEEAILKHCDVDAIDRVIEEEEKQKAALRKAMKKAKGK